MHGIFINPIVNYATWKDADSTETLNRLYRQFGIDYQITDQPRDYWLGLIEALAEQAQNIPAVQEIYIAGGLTRGKEKAKDGDVAIVLNCSGQCPLAGIKTKLDLLCFTPEDLEGISCVAPAKHGLPCKA